MPPTKVANQPVNPRLKIVVVVVVKPHGGRVHPLDQLGTVIQVAVINMDVMVECEVFPF
jgi:hypothetical protein